MIKKEFFHDNCGRPTYLLGLGEGTYIRYYLKKDISGYYEFWNCDHKLHGLTYRTMRESFLTSKEFKKLEKMLFIYSTSRNARIMHSQYKEYIDNDAVCYYTDLEIEMEDRIDALLRTYH